jgi:hypothetical protein
VTTPVRVRAVRHQCPFCRRTWSKRPAAEAHIARCWCNPAARSCKTCVHYEPFEPGGCYGPEVPERCGAGVDISDRLPTGCPDHNAEEVA